jgi:hypothetical protein
MNRGDALLMKPGAHLATIVVALLSVVGGGTLVASRDDPEATLVESIRLQSRDSKQPFGEAASPARGMYYLPRHARDKATPDEGRDRTERSPTRNDDRAQEQEDRGDPQPAFLQGDEAPPAAADDGEGADPVSPPPPPAAGDGGDDKDDIGDDDGGDD